MFPKYLSLLALLWGVYADRNVTRASGEFSVAIGPNPDSWQTISTATPFGCDATSANIAVTHSSVIGASLSTTFTGTAVYVNAIVDVDRGLASVVLDQTSLDVPAWSSVRSCSIIFSKIGMPNQDHTISVVVKDVHNNSTKVEIISFIFTVPDSNSPNATLTLPTSNSPTGNASSSSSGSSLSAGALAGITIGAAVVGGFIILASFLLFRQQRAKQNAAGAAATVHSIPPMSPNIHPVYDAPYQHPSYTGGTVGSAHRHHLLASYHGSPPQSTVSGELPPSIYPARGAYPGPPLSPAPG